MGDVSERQRGHLRHRRRYRIQRPALPPQRHPGIGDRLCHRRLRPAHSRLHAAADLGLSQAQGASLVTATLFGAVVGGFTFGWLSDRLGRVRVLAWTIVLFAVFTGLCALAQGYYDLLFYRTIAGLGLGGEFGIGMAL